MDLVPLPLIVGSIVSVTGAAVSIWTTAQGSRRVQAEADRTAIDGFSELCKRLQERIKANEEELAALREELAKLRTENEDLRRQMRALEDENVQLRAQLEELKKRRVRKT